MSYINLSCIPNEIKAMVKEVTKKETTLLEK